MRISTLIRALAVIGLIGLFLFGPIAYTAWRVLQNASGYRDATLVVTGRHCIGGETTTDAQGRTTTSPRYCFVEGEIDRVKVSLSVGSSLDGAAADGASVRVLYNASLPEAGVNYEPLGVLPWVADLRGIYARRLASVGMVEIVGLATAIALFATSAFGVWRRSERGPRAISADAGGSAAPTTGLVLSSFGLALLSAQVSHPATGGVVIGLVLSAIGVLLLRRRFIQAERGSFRVIEGRHLMGIGGMGAERTLAAPSSIAVAPSRCGAVVSAICDGTPVTLAKDVTWRRARDFADGLGALWECPVAVAEPPKRPLGSRLRPIALPLAIVAMLIILFAVPAPRMAACTFLISPGDHGPLVLLRPVALRIVASDRSDEATLVLLRIVATTTFDQGGEHRTAALAALRARGAPEDEGGDDDAIYAWGARKVGKQLDGNGGILRWFPVSTERYRKDLDRIAGPDVRDAFWAWDTFAIGDFSTPEELLWYAGAALGDSRPIRFAATRTYVTTRTLPAEGAQAIDAVPDVLAHTVAEAIALHLVGYKGVGGEQYPADFHATWRELALTHHLPATGCGVENDGPPSP